MIQFFKTTLWTTKLADHTPVVRAMLNMLRIAILSSRFFLKNNCMLRASALTYYTLLSIIPVAALAFAIAKGFGLYTRLERWLRHSLADKPEVAEKIIEFASSLLESARGGIIAGFGAIALLIITIRLMMQIENSLNDIWGVKTGRTLIRKISDYLSIVLLCPLLIITSTGITVYATMRLSSMAKDFPGLSEPMMVLLALSSKALPFLMTWLVFTFIYIFIPNTKVKILPALTGGLIGGLLYYVVQALYLAAQYTVAKYNAIYGSFAALPLFLIWLQMSWTFILLGAEIAFSCQNVSSYEGTPGDGDVGLARKHIYAIKIVRLCATAFAAKALPLTDVEISRRLEIPVRTTRQILYELTCVHLLSKVLLDERMEAYQVAVPPETLTPISVIRALQNLVPDEGLDTSDPVYQNLNRIWESAEKSIDNRPLIEMGVAEPPQESSRLAPPFSRQKRTPLFPSEK